MKSLILPAIVVLTMQISATFHQAAADSVDMDAATVTVSEQQDGFQLTIDQIGVNDTAYQASWSLDLSDGSWRLSAASEGSSADLRFQADSGIRADYASNPGAAVDRLTGTVYLYYEYRTDSGPGAQMLATAQDGLAFSAGQTPGSEHARLNPRAVLLPDGTWRKYIYSENDGGLISESSGNGTTFSRDSGVRYTLQPEDMNSFGVYTVYVDHIGGVVLLYIGDMQGDDNIRRAYSSDGGATFTAETDNLLGDRDLDATMKHVDPKTILLPDGRRRLLTMRRGANGTTPVPGQRSVGEIHTFISNNGKEYAHEPGIRLLPEDFGEFAVWSLNDPVMVRLNDGRYRIYVAAMVDDTSPQAPAATKWVIVSATSEQP